MPGPHRVTDPAHAPTVAPPGAALPAPGHLAGPPQVKVCGLVRAEDAAQAAEAGAAFVGSIFAGGPRAVDAPTARRNAEAARAAARAAGLVAPQAVGVLADQRPELAAQLAAEAGLDILQLHADPDAATVDAMRRAWAGPVWAVLRVEGAELPRHARALFAAADAVVLDARVPGALGGTGVALPWARLAGAVDAVRGLTPLVLAGGLRPENVAEAVAGLAPAVVDVSSGVERAPGVKDPRRVLSFIAGAHAAGRPGARPGAATGA